MDPLVEPHIYLWYFNQFPAFERLKLAPRTTDTIRRLPEPQMQQIDAWIAAAIARGEQQTRDRFDALEF